MPDYFRSPATKLERAKNNILRLERQRDLFVNDCAWSHVVEVHPSGEFKQFKIRFARELPDIFSELALNAVRELRECLDHTVNAAARASGVADPRSAYFPIANTAKELENGIKGRCKDVPPDIVAIIRGFQPYRTRTPVPFLWALNVLCNSEKHAVVTPMAAIPSSIIFGGPESLARPLRMHPTVWDAAKNEITYAACAIDLTPEHNFHITVDIAFHEIKGMGIQPAIVFLDRLSVEVNRVFLVIEAATMRLFPTSF